MKKKIILFCIISAAFIIPGINSDSSGFGGCEKDCLKCHSIEKQEIQNILSKMNAPDTTKIIGVNMSPVKGLWEVTIEDKDRKGIMYVDFSKSHVIGGTIFNVDGGANRTQESLGKFGPPADIYVDMGKVSLDNTLLMGEKDAQYKVIVFTDPDCPFCGRLHAELKKVLAERKDIAFYLKLMPLDFHPDAHWKSQTIFCSKSLQYLEDNFEKKPIPKQTCESTAIDDNIRLGAELGVTGTPTLILPDGLVVVGARDAQTIINLVLNPRKKGA